MIILVFLIICTTISGDNISIISGMGYSGTSTCSTLVCPAGKIADLKTCVCVSCPAGTYETTFRKEWPYMYHPVEGYFSVQPQTFNSFLVPVYYGSNGKVFKCYRANTNEIARYVIINQFNTILQDLQIACQGGTQDLIAYGRCQECPSGKYSGTGAGGCTFCDAGTFNSGIGQADCLNCGNGKISEMQGQSYCNDCAIGKYSISTTVCESCGTGKYGSSIGLNYCQICEVGKYQSRIEQIQCESCPEGSYADEIGLSICKGCPSFTSSAMGSMFLNQCLAIKGYVGNGQIGVTQCPPDYYCVGNNVKYQCPLNSNSVLGSTTINECFANVGYFGTGNSIQLCTTGYYCPFSNGNKLICDPGFFCSSQGLTAQVQCLVGTISSTQGTISCSPCIDGKFQTFTGKTFCHDCSPACTSSQFYQFKCTNQTDVQCCDRYIIYNTIYNVFLYKHVCYHNPYYFNYPNVQVTAMFGG